MSPLLILGLHFTGECVRTVARRTVRIVACDVRPVFVVHKALVVVVRDVAVERTNTRTRAVTLFFKYIIIQPLIKSPVNAMITHAQNSYLFTSVERLDCVERLLVRLLTLRSASISP